MFTCRSCGRPIADNSYFLEKSAMSRHLTGNSNQQKPLPTPSDYDICYRQSGPLIRNFPFLISCGNSGSFREMPVSGFSSSHPEKVSSPLSQFPHCDRLHTLKRASPFSRRSYRPRRYDGIHCTLSGTSFHGFHG